MTNIETRPVVIIGAGVSGSSTAIRLLKEGITPLVVDQAKFPREIVGEGLSPYTCDYLEELGVLEEINQAPFMKKSSLQLVSPDGSKAYAKVDLTKEPYADGIHAQPWGFNVKRKDFDYVLFRKAQRDGAEIRESTKVKEILLNDEGAVTGVVLEDEHNQKTIVHTSLVIDCSGRTSKLAQQLKLRAPLEKVFDGQWANYAIRCYFKDVNLGPLRSEGQDDYDIATVNILPDRNCWYWIIPLEENLFSIGFVARSKTKQMLDSQVDKMRAYRDLIEKHHVLREVVKEAEMLENVVVTARLGHMNTRMAGDGFICVGDAGFFADPAWATGVTVALITSKLATEVVMEAIQKKNFSHQLLKKYEDLYHGYIKNRFNSIRAYNTYYNDTDYVNFLVKRLSHRPEEMHLITAVLFDYMSHHHFNSWTFKVFKDYVAKTGKLPVVNKVAQLNFDSEESLIQPLT
ncbi:NAD(P)/FAD-dependent oxidoreductase [Hazenella coriacea]|uniref:Flavin-dependent dehydrogenase n=1 Tax=Hazenella coriacea TaxID=1179467 RepID=A0A4V2UVH4_9BACL|nr:NAD(P)/FAD-dependent oxidoreductase [Hazenella coriacea]TCS95797.1 flavin-dependent dehydrogenase [Hazenella coriacea]